MSSPSDLKPRIFRSSCEAECRPLSRAAGAAQIGKLRTRVRSCGRKQKETRYLITSASTERLDALGLLDAKRGYWAIEASLHYRRRRLLRA